MFRPILLYSLCTFSLKLVEMKNKHDVRDNFFVVVGIDSSRSFKSFLLPLVPQQRKERVNRVLRNTHSSLLPRVTASGQLSTTFRSPIAGNRICLQSVVQNQVHRVSPRPLDEMLNFVNLFFFWRLAFFLNNSSTHIGNLRIKCYKNY